MLAFVQAIEKQHSITIDGYTSNKTEKDHEKIRELYKRSSKCGYKRR